jgi:hypothetical protein
MRRYLLLMVFAVTLITPPLVAQTDCKVLIPAIADYYEGGCRKGLADGTGEAFGADQYRGGFSKGLPDGIGTYIWQSGAKYEGEWKKGLRDGQGTYIFNFMGRDSVLTGIWKADQYVGEKEVPPYVIKYRNGIGRVTCMRVGGNPEYIRYKFSRSGESSTAQISDLLLTGSSGNESTTGNFLGFEDVKFPFEGKVRFTAPNAFNTAMISGELRFVINQPGAWTVTIFY